MASSLNWAAVPAPTDAEADDTVLNDDAGWSALSAEVRAESASCSVIASEAKESSGASSTDLDCCVSAPRNDT